MTRRYHVYILANYRRTLYIGVTGNLHVRLQQHEQGLGSPFVTRYGLKRLVYVESAARALDAIAREKQLKRWLRARKIALIETLNPEWLDLAVHWGWRKQ